MSLTSTVTFTVNGTPRSVGVAASQTLLDVLRDELGLRGTKECCAEGECGACTVIVDGRSVDSCLVLGVEAEGFDITTIEGLEDEDGLSVLQDEFLAAGAVQCGFCIPGMVMSARALLDRSPAPDAADVREGLSGNLCRCAGYGLIVDAVLRAAAREASA